MEGQSKPTNDYLWIHKKAINRLPLKAYTGKIVMVDQQSKVPSALEALRQEKVLGFDTESRPAFRKGESYPPSLIQLGSEDNIYLFQIAKLRNMKGITALLSDPSILKAGVAIDEDIKKLQSLNHFEPAGFVEISTYTRPKGIVNTGLRSLAALYLGFRISEAAQVTNWSHTNLSKTQIRYAATDAWASFLLYKKLHQLGIIP